MVICRTPVRISFFGGGTDYPEWFLRNGGQVLATTIDKYTYVTCRFLESYYQNKYRFSYSKIENVNSIDDIEHPLIKGCLKFLKIKKGLEIHYDADLPAHSGLGTSSSFAVGLLKSLTIIDDKKINRVDLTRHSIHIEREILNETGGYQDQISAAYGGFNHIYFNESGNYKINKIGLSEETKNNLCSHLMLFYTGLQRFSSDIAIQQVERIKQNKQSLHRIHNLVDEAIKSIRNNSIIDFGELLNETWILKKSLSDSVSNNYIDELYEQSKDAGALGGKLCGAGAGGFLLIFAKPERHNAIRKKLKQLVHVPFKFENCGSRVLFNDAKI